MSFKNYLIRGLDVNQLNDIVLEERLYLKKYEFSLESFQTWKNTEGKLSFGIYDKKNDELKAFTLFSKINTLYPRMKPGHHLIYIYTIRRASMNLYWVTELIERLADTFEFYMYAKSSFGRNVISTMSSFVKVTKIKNGYTIYKSIQSS